MNALILLLVVMTAIVNVMLVATPWIMPQTECFAVTVPSGARDEEPLRGIMRAYTQRMVLVGLVCVAAWPIAWMLLRVDVAAFQTSPMVPVLVSVLTLVQIAVAQVLMLHYRRRVRAIKEERGWHVEHPRSAALVGPEDYPKPISLRWNLLYIPLVLGMVAFGLINYDRFPDMLPIHVGADGSVVDYAPKSYATVLFPVGMTAFLGIIMTLAHWGILRSKRPIDPDAPASSALSYGRFARLMSQFLIGGGLLISLLVGVTYYASALGAVSIMAAAVIVVGASLVYVIAATVLGLHVGQAGARLRETSQSGEMARDDDAYWPLGLFYVNRDDPSIFVPKRFGVGWTLNLARPGSWAMLVGLILIAVLFAWGTSVMMP